MRCRIKPADANHNETDYAYDARHLRRSLTYPATTGPAAQIAWTYDVDGNIATVTTANGRTRTFQVDALNRTTSESKAHCLIGYKISSQVPILVGYGRVNQFQPWAPVARLSNRVPANSLHLFGRSVVDWKREIVIAHLVKQKIVEVDAEGLWTQPFPNLAATSEAISAAESKNGCSFNSEHRDFLAHADGWEAFYQAVDVLSTSDYLGGSRLERAATLLDSLEDFHELCGHARDDVMPIAVSANDIDVFFTVKPNIAGRGTVFWCAGQLIDKFPSFGEWFLAMVDYNRLEYQRLKGA